MEGREIDSIRFNSREAATAAPHTVALQEPFGHSGNTPLNCRDILLVLLLFIYPLDKEKQRD